MLFPPLVIQSTAAGTLSPELITQVRAFKMGPYFKRYLDQIEQGDIYALAELWLNTEGALVQDFNFEHGWNYPLGQQEFRKKVIALLEQRRFVDPGPACYYLAELGFLWRDRYGRFEAKAEDTYATLLEESSRYGFAWADYRIFEYLDRGDGGNPYVNALQRRRGSRALGADRRELWEQWRRKAMERLLPLARNRSVKAEQALLSMADGLSSSQFNFDPGNYSPTQTEVLYKREQVLGWLDDAANDGSSEARSAILWIRWNEKHTFPQRPGEGSAEFKEIESLAEQNHYPSILYLVRYYIGQKAWDKAKAWATKGKVAIGQTNRFLEEAWSEITPPESE